MFADFSQGFLIELTLVVTVGLQNAFILKQGLQSSYVWAAALTCWICETLLVTIGVAGMGAVVSSKPALIFAVMVAGIGFLSFYAIKSFYAAFKAGTTLQTEGIEGNKSFMAVVTAGVGFALLNPHVLIDTTLMGALSAKFYPHQWVFWFGVITAALVWYTFLAIAGKLLAKPLKSKKTWRVINVVIGIFCLYMAINFALNLNEPHGHDEHSSPFLMQDGHGHE